MNHENYRELLTLSIYDDLDPADRETLDQHVRTCDACRAEMNELARLQTALGRKRRSEPTEHLLQEARTQLRAALRVERSKPTLSERLSNWIPVAPVYRWSMAAAAMLVIGIFIGRYAWAPKPAIVATVLPPKTATTNASDPMPPSGVQITNVRFVDSDASDGQVEFTFDAIHPMRIKGNIQDPKVQRVLVYAIANENPGVRLRAVNTLKEYPAEKPDPEVKTALIKALKSDKNEGVRKEAMTVLQKMEMDDQIKAAFLFVLKNDSNPMLRIEAIKSLQSEHKDKDVQEVLKDKQQSDDNSYIRLKAKSLLHEASATM
jgi:hypothetical protein